MPKNKQALLRYQIIDACLSNRFHANIANKDGRYWSAIELADKVSDELAISVSSRTIRYDIFDLKNAVLGIPVPIENKRGLGYYYTQKGFHLFNMRLKPDEVFHLSEAVQHIEQLMMHQYFRNLSESLRKLNLQTISDDDMVLSLQAYNNPPAYKWLSKMVDAIESNQVVEIDYQPYKPPKQLKLKIHPYLIKEYNQRLYVLAWDEINTEYYVFGLDRIKAMKAVKSVWKPIPVGMKTSYFKDIVGLSLPRNFKIEKIQIEIFSSRIPYILSKPLHASQKYIRKNDDWGLFEFDLIVNRDLKAWILEKGKDARVLKPEHLRSEIVIEMDDALKNYYKG
ncbi:MAG: WYL domain-containing protein [Bacteroidota bacterium]|nr:WYL domain-containing protein [Bacteroidota bacterium]